MYSDDEPFLNMNLKNKIKQDCDYKKKIDNIRLEFIITIIQAAYNADDDDIKIKSNKTINI